MELVVFDMDRTLLNARSEITPYTAETLRRMSSAGIAYTVATGRTLQAARGPIADHGFTLPHIIKNGAVIWCPHQQEYSHSHLLTPTEVWHVLAAFTIQELTPFVFTLEENGRHAVYHPALKNETEAKLAQLFEEERHLPVEPISEMPEDAAVINISAMGASEKVQAVITSIDNEPSLVAYTGIAAQAGGLRWLDIHHSLGSKGNGIATLREELPVTKVIVFGDGENDLSMFDIADESYAPENADDEIKAIASEVIGHHDEDGVARFLRQRFNLGD